MGEEFGEGWKFHLRTLVMRPNESPYGFYINLLVSWDCNEDSLS